VEVAMHPRNWFDCRTCDDNRKIQRGCRSHSLESGEYAPLRPPDKSCRAEEKTAESGVVMKALWSIDSGLASLHDMDAWFVEAVQIAQCERNRLDQARIGNG
jgi:hypothetical protein